MGIRSNHRRSGSALGAGDDCPPQGQGPQNPGSALDSFLFLRRDIEEGCLLHERLAGTPDGRLDLSSIFPAEDSNIAARLGTCRPFDEPRRSSPTNSQHKPRSAEFSAVK